MQHILDAILSGDRSADTYTGLDLPETAVPPVFECLTDRTYGQTRIILWTPKNPASPSTPEPSIP